jgi:16S rRNA (guanine(966)-N(2))-methyltransferase RsmD
VSDRTSRGTLRVIAGALKGRRLRTPDWGGLRPTSDKLRETLFNVLAARVAGAIVLDGYAGTGAIGIEALSRGAAHVTFVERDPRAAALIESNLRACGIEERYAIIRAAFGDAAARIGEVRDGMIFLDPPYGPDELAAALASAEPMVGPGTTLILEHARRDAAPEVFGTLARTRELVSGDSALAFYVQRTADAREQRP